MTIRGANLGCGKLLFPIDREDAMVNHVRYAIDAMCPEAYERGVQWDNYDKLVEDSQKARQTGEITLKRLDLFRYPWDIPDNTYDILWLSHIAEHIPHEPKLSTLFAPNGQTLAEKMMAKEFDGWFVFFGECWRILKPGGKMHVLSPYGLSVAGMSDPTHTRYLLPATFGYFAIDKNAPFDYALPYGFQQITHAKEATPGEGSVMKFVDRSATLVNAIDTLENKYYDLPENDRGDSARYKILEEIKSLRDELQSYSIQHFNQVSEFIYSFTPVKQ